MEGFPQRPPSLSVLVCNSFDILAVDKVVELVLMPQ